jgi:non-specific serine/threonine protein kinase
LTERELEVARLVVSGLTNRQIAQRLVLSVRTVDAHIDHIRNKLSLRSRAQIAAWVTAEVR